MDTLERVKRIVAEELGIEWESINPNDDIEDELGADSLHMANIVMAAEDAFGVSVPDEEAVGLRTAAQIAGYVDAKIAKMPSLAAPR